MAEQNEKKAVEPKVLTVSSSPHLAERSTSRRVMFEVVLGMVPATVMSVYLFQWCAVTVLLSCLVSALATEWLFNVVRKKPQTIGDGSVIVTALILGLSLPPTLPWWVAVVGTVVAVAVAKMLFGGLGSNIFNPAMVGRAFLMASFGSMMTSWVLPYNQPPEPAAVSYATITSDAASASVKEGVEGDSTEWQLKTPIKTGATPLALAKQVIKDANNPDKAAEDKKSVAVVNGQWKSMFMGNISGSAGETSALLWLIGGLWLLYRRTITYHIPLAVLASAMVVATLAWLVKGEVYANPLVHLSGGGLMMCAFFIATDPVSCPLSKSGRVIFGIGVGVLIMLIRLIGGYPEGVMYAVLLMNSLTPLLDRWTRPTPLGGHVRAS